MNAIKMAAIALIIAGALGLGYSSFSYTKETQEARIGPIELTIQELLISRCREKHHTIESVNRCLSRFQIALMGD
ncbi:MAG: hypothetical protein HC889_08845 [Synechococcaceae cyanobacterium SM1_2_3]|nr:hypothetical protein [Synechococcaceae cyanobacterium SM1_2_3]